MALKAGIVGLPNVGKSTLFLYEKIKITPVFMAPLLSLWC